MRNKAECIVDSVFDLGFIVYHVATSAVIYVSPRCGGAALVAPTESAGVLEIASVAAWFPASILDESVIVEASLAGLALASSRYGWREIIDALGKYRGLAREEIMARELLARYVLTKRIASRNESIEDAVAAAEKMLFMLDAVEGGRLRKPTLFRDWVIAWTGPESPFVRLVAYSFLLSLLSESVYARNVRECRVPGFYTE